VFVEPEQCVDPRAAGSDFIRKAHSVENGHTRRLQHQAGPQRLWLIESLEQRHLVTIAMQQDGRGKACRTTSNDRDVVSLADTLSRATACVAPVGDGGR